MQQEDQVEDTSRINFAKVWCDDKYIIHNSGQQKQTVLIAYWHWIQKYKYANLYSIFFMGKTCVLW